jgi:hypothetical protein
MPGATDAFDQETIARMILVDTSIWVEVLRDRAGRWDALANSCRIAIGTSRRSRPCVR